MTKTESIKFDKLQEENDAPKAENETLKKELAEKDKEWEKLVLEIYDLQQRQLYKEDFDEYCQYVNGRREDTFIIKDKSLYKKLPNKEVK
ncbi:hypothetical protein SKUN_001318 [Spiroplasma kunkelii CR2-3x]|uniref:Uncharacterized protein n=1 Tax=Spiroplasma kunkelii CR2-3x TaxID=273035 RepID=A0A0K2JIY7_SPIKU|nr:hypothetical protein [Spiroplasma kunkelii]ALA98191.1 hypothetical protein SKUN_001318 [Spiroplasma kunkelii CR2-3x]